MYKVFCGLVSTWVLGAAAEDEVDGGDDPVRDQGWANDGHQGRGCVVGGVSVVVVVEAVGDGGRAGQFHGQGDEGREGSATVGDKIRLDNPNRKTY